MSEQPGGPGKGKSASRRTVTGSTQSGRQSDSVPPVVGTTNRAAVGEQTRQAAQQALLERAGQQQQQQQQQQTMAELLLNQQEMSSSSTFPARLGIASTMTGTRQGHCSQRARVAQSFQDEFSELRARSGPRVSGSTGRTKACKEGVKYQEGAKLPQKQAVGLGSATGSAENRVVESTSSGRSTPATPALQTGSLASSLPVTAPAAALPPGTSFHGRDGGSVPDATILPMPQRQQQTPEAELCRDDEGPHDYPNLPVLAWTAAHGASTGCQLPPFAKTQTRVGSASQLQGLEVGGSAGELATQLDSFRADDCRFQDSITLPSVGPFLGPDPAPQESSSTEFQEDQTALVIDHVAYASLDEFLLDKEPQGVEIGKRQGELEELQGLDFARRPESQAAAGSGKQQFCPDLEGLAGTGCADSGTDRLRGTKRGRDCEAVARLEERRVSGRLTSRQPDTQQKLSLLEQWCKEQLGGGVGHSGEIKPSHDKESQEIQEILVQLQQQQLPEQQQQQQQQQQQEEERHWAQKPEQHDALQEVHAQSGKKWQQHLLLTDSRVATPEKPGQSGGPVPDSTCQVLIPPEVKGTLSSCWMVLGMELWEKGITFGLERFMHSRSEEGSPASGTPCEDSSQGHAGSEASQEGAMAEGGDTVALGAKAQAGIASCSQDDSQAPGNIGARDLTQTPRATTALDALLAGMSKHASYNLRGGAMGPEIARSRRVLGHEESPFATGGGASPGMGSNKSENKLCTLLSETVQRKPIQSGPPPNEVFPLARFLELTRKLREGKHAQAAGRMSAKQHVLGSPNKNWGGESPVARGAAGISEAAEAAYKGDPQILGHFQGIPAASLQNPSQLISAALGSVEQALGTGQGAGPASQHPARSAPFVSPFTVPINTFGAPAASQTKLNDSSRMFPSFVVPPTAPHGPPVPAGGAAAAGFHIPRHLQPRLLGANAEGRLPPAVGGLSANIAHEEGAKKRLLLTAEALERADMVSFHLHCSSLRPAAKKRGNALERTVHTMLQALTLRKDGKGFAHLRKQARSTVQDLDNARMWYYTGTPLIPFAVIASAGAILPKLRGRSAVHVINIGEVMLPQYPGILELLAGRGEASRSTGVLPGEGATEEVCGRPDASSGRNVVWERREQGGPAAADASAAMEMVLESGEEPADASGTLPTEQQQQQQSLRSFRVTKINAWTLVRPGRRDIEMMLGHRRVASLLRKTAAELGVEFDFHDVDIDENNNLMDVLERHVQARRCPDEAVVVCITYDAKFLSEELPSGTSALQQLMQWLSHLRPDVLSLAEEYWGAEDDTFLSRFEACMETFLATCKLHDATCEPRSPSWNLLHTFEQQYFVQNLCNVVSCEGPQRRVRPRSPSQWRELLHSFGFQQARPRSSLLSVCAELIGSYSPHLGLREADKNVALTWEGQPLVFVSQWRM